MGRFLFFIGIGVFCVLLQTNLFLHNVILPLKLDLTVPLTLYIGLSQKTSRGVFLVFWFGLLLDAFSASTMGMYAFLRVLMFLFIQILRKGLFLENGVFFGVLVLGLFLFETVFISFLFRFSGLHFISWQKIPAFALTHGLFALAVWYVSHPFFVKLEGSFKKPWSWLSVVRHGF